MHLKFAEIFACQEKWECDFNIHFFNIDISLNIPYKVIRF